LIKNLEDIVNEVISEHSSSLLDIQRGNGRAIDKLVFDVLHRSKIKTDPRKVRQLILSKL